MNGISLTWVLGVDARTIQQATIACETWRIHRPELWKMPLLVFYDCSQLQHSDMLNWVADVLGYGCQYLQVEPWPGPANPTYESQREKMLSGHVWMPSRFVKTEWYMKLDTDVTASSGAGRWLDPEWFGEDTQYVAPRWGYTKGVNFLNRLDDWGDATHAIHKYPRLNIPQERPDQLRVPHQRWCSWVSYYRTSFARLCTILCEFSVGQDKLPVPSQDTLMWYVAERMKLNGKIANQKRLGWENHAKLESLQRRVQEIRQAEAAGSVTDG
jgi:hypothetical protein